MSAFLLLLILISLLAAVAPGVLDVGHKLAMAAALMLGAVLLLAWLPSNTPNTPWAYLLLLPFGLGAIGHAKRFLRPRGTQAPLSTTRDANC